MNFDDETGVDRIDRSTAQMKAMLAMLHLYLEAAHNGQTDILTERVLQNYLWAIERDLDFIVQGRDEAQEIIKQAKQEAGNIRREIEGGSHE